MTSERIASPGSELELEACLAVPDSETIDCMRRLPGDIVILGAGGKMGPSLCHLVRNACREAGVQKRVIAVSRFSDPRPAQRLRDVGVEVISRDLTDPAAFQNLPHVENVIFMVGRKFGHRGSESQTWMTNVVVPGWVTSAFRDSRIVAFSTGCVYPLVTRESGGSKETDPPEPIGEYANSCLGRERIFEYAAETYGTRILLFRLNYAIDLRYGVLHDIAKAVYGRRPVSLSVKVANVIWQGDANNRALRALEHTTAPAAILNVTGSEILEVRDLARRFADRFQCEVTFEGDSSENRAYLSDASRSIELFGRPRVSVEQMIEWTADWIRQGGVSLGKPTHFQVTDGQFLDDDKG